MGAMVIMDPMPVTTARTPKITRIAATRPKAMSARFRLRSARNELVSATSRRRCRVAIIS